MTITSALTEVEIAKASLVGGFPLRIAGDLEFDYIAENGGFVDVQWSHTFRKIGSGSSGSGGGGR